MNFHIKQWKQSNPNHEEECRMFTKVYVPMVPPNSMTHTSAGPSFPSTGMWATLSIQS